MQEQDYWDRMIKACTEKRRPTWLEQWPNAGFSKAMGLGLSPSIDPEDTWFIERLPDGDAIYMLNPDDFRTWKSWCGLRRLRDY